MHGLVQTWRYPDTDILAGCVFRADSLSILGDSSTPEWSVSLGQYLSASTGDHPDKSSCSDD